MLRASGITRRLGDREVLSGVSLEVEPGAVLGVLGPNGAGKSTLFRILVGEDRPDRGSVRLFDRDVTREPLHVRARLGIGYLPQGPSVLPDLSAIDNVRAFVALHRSIKRDRGGLGRGRAGGDIPRRERGSVRADADALLDRVGLSSRAAIAAARLSGGERRRLELARVLAGKPTVVVADEPFAALDPRSADTVEKILRGAAADGAAVLVCDHRARRLLACVSMAILLVAGEVALHAAPDVIRDSDIARRLYLGEE